MTQSAKIKVIKRSTKSAPVTPVENPPQPPEQRAGQVSRNISDWVREIQARKRDEDRAAAESFFGYRMGSSGI